MDSLDGMRQAAQHADDVEPGWSDRAYGVLLKFASTRDAFITPELRQYAASSGFPLPTTNMAWGGVVRRAVCAKKIVQIGTQYWSDAVNHPRLVPVWRVVSDADK